MIETGLATGVPWIGSFGGLMKKITVVLLVLVAAVVVLSTSAHASAMDNVVITGTYDSSASSTAFSGPSGAFTLSFTLPTTLGPGMLDTDIPVTIGFGGSTTTINNGTEKIRFFLGGAQGGGLDIDFTDNSNNPFEWQLFGPQLFDSSNDLLLGNFPIASSSDDTSQLVDGSGNTLALITGGTIAISPGTTGVTPEPSSLLLLGTGLLALGPLVRRGLA